MAFGDTSFFFHIWDIFNQESHTLLGGSRIANDSFSEARFTLPSYRNFLRYEEYYDDLLAVNMASHAANWEVLTLLATCRCLQKEVLEALAALIVASNSDSHNIDDINFLLALSEPTLTQSLLIHPKQSGVLFSYVTKNIEKLPIEVLRKFGIQLDPSQPCAIPVISRLFQKRKTNTSLDSTLDSEDANTDEIGSNLKDFIEAFVCVLTQLVYTTSRDE